MFRLWSQDCKPGWGYNKSFSRLIHSEEESSSRTLHTTNTWYYLIDDLSSTIIPSFDSISYFLDPNCRKILDFRIVFEDYHYWEVHCDLYRRRDGCQKLQNYSSTCTHYVTWIEYGVDLRVQFPKMGFPDGKFTVSGLFQKRKFTESQKNVKCRVWINFSETREMTLEDLLVCLKELDEGKYSEYYIPVHFYFDKLTPEFKENSIINEAEFAKFLSYLYCVYRKIEMKMEKAGYPDVLPDPEPKEKSFIRICIDLAKAKDDYDLMDRNDFLQIYPVLKKLFFSYIDYIKYLMDNGSDIDEGKYLPGTPTEMTPWLRKLNTWIPKRVNEKWLNCMDFIIIVPPGYEQVVEKIRKTAKYSHCEVVNDDGAEEPYIKNDNEVILFGFVDMEENEGGPVPDAPILFESDCPEQCTQSSRRWICTKCGEFVGIRSEFVEQLLFCPCGSKRYRNNILNCHHKNHPQGEPRKKPVNIRSTAISSFQLQTQGGFMMNY